MNYGAFTKSAYNVAGSEFDDSLLDNPFSMAFSGAAGGLARYAMHRWGSLESHLFSFEFQILWNRFDFSLFLRWPQGPSWWPKRWKPKGWSTAEREARVNDDLAEDDFAVVDYVDNYN